MPHGEGLNTRGEETCSETELPHRMFAPKSAVVVHGATLGLIECEIEFQRAAFR
jgi:hypothetical protein